MSFAYAGNPANYPVSITLMSDGVDAPSFANFNTGFEGLADRTAALRSVVQTATFMPNGVVAQFGTTGIQAGAWDPVNRKWILAGVDATPHLIVVSGRGDPLGGWALLGPAATASPYTGLTASSVCRGVEPAVSNKYVYVASVTIGSPALPQAYVARLNTVTAAWDTLTPLNVSASDIFEAQLLSVPGVIVCSLGAASAGHTNVYYSIDHGATWTAQAALTVTAGSRWVIAQKTPGGGPILAFPTAGGITSFLSSADGTTWVRQTGITLGASEVATGLCWGADSLGIPCWILTTNDTTPDVTNTYKSYNGISFAAFTNTVPVSLPISTLAAIGSLIVGTLQRDASPVRVVYSANGGVDWATTNASLVIATTGAVVGGPNQFLGYGGFAACTSLCYGSPGGIGAH